MWKTNLGVTVNFIVVDKGDMSGKIIKNSPNLFRLGWVADYNDPDNFLKGIFHSDSEYNYGGFRSSEFDNLVDQAAKETDPGIRQDLYIQAERILCEDQAAVIPIYFFESNIP